MVAKEGDAAPASSVVAGMLVDGSTDSGDEAAEVGRGDLLRRLDRNEVILDGKKGRRPVIIPVQMSEKLRELMPESGRGRVFEVTKGTIQSQLSQRYLKKTCRDLGIRYFTPHAVRRMVIDQYYENGVDVGTVASQLGQSPKIALKYYRQATRTKKQRALAVAGVGERPAAETKVLDLEQTRRKKEGA